MTANTEPVEMLDENGKRFLVKSVVSKYSGQVRWTAAKWIETKGHFSSTYYLRDIEGWTKASKEV